MLLSEGGFETELAIKAIKVTYLLVKDSIYLVLQYVLLKLWRYVHSLSKIPKFPGGKNFWKGTVSGDSQTVRFHKISTAGN